MAWAHEDDVLPADVEERLGAAKDGVGDEGLVERRAIVPARAPRRNASTGAPAFACPRMRRRPALVPAAAHIKP